MKLESKKELAARTLNIGKARIAFNIERLAQIKEAITKQDIRDLQKDGAIIIKEIKGRRKNIKRKTRRRIGSVKMKVNKKKREYMNLTRKLRTYTKSLRKTGQVDNETYRKIRKEIRAKSFRSKAHLKERITTWQHT